MLRARWIAGLVAGAVIVGALTGCGSSAPRGGPVQTELSYLPPSSPLVLTIQTDPNSAGVKNTLAFLNRFPFTPLLESALISRLKQAGVDYDADVKPLFGNPVVVAATGYSLSAGSGPRRFVLVWVTKSSSALNSLVHRTSSGLHRVGSLRGATVYGTAGKTTIAVDGATVVLGPNRDEVINALNRHWNGGGISADEYSRSTTGLPADAFVYAFGNLQRILAEQRLLAAGSSADRARRIPWVAAIHRYGVFIAPSSSGVTVRFHVDTSGSSLTPDQLPLVPGPATPRLASGFPISAGLHDPQHVVAFIETGRRLSGSAKYAASQRRQARLRARTGSNFNLLVRQLTGDVVLGSDVHATLGRADVRDPAATAKMLANISKDPADAFPGSTVTSGGGLYIFHKRDGTTETLGVASGTLVFGFKAQPAQIRAFATAPTVPAAGAQGPVAFRVALPELIALATKNASSRIPPALLKSLGDLTGSASDSVSGLDGSATIAVK